MEDGHVPLVAPSSLSREFPPQMVGAVQLAALMIIGILAAGCGQQARSLTDGRTDPGEAGAAAPTAASAPATPQTGEANPARSVEAEDLISKSSQGVATLLGKPQGTIQTKRGALWLYPNWRVQFDAADLVLGVEQDFPLPLAALDPKVFGPRTRPGPAGAGSAPAGTANKVTVVSNGGQEVDLLGLMLPGKVTVVDFYADWCGPCRQISPYLERMAAQDPDIVLVKVDIVDWQTPVTRQFGIRSIPNILVFDRRKAQVGNPTHDLRQVADYVKRAKL